MKVITFRVEKQDKEKIREVANNLGLDMASYCRYLVLKKIKEIELKEAENGEKR